MAVSIPTLLEFVLRWLHVFFGVMWIGHLYYFNFTQGTFLNDAGVEASAKTTLRIKLLPVALYYFRWGAMWTFVTGLLYLGHKFHTYPSFSDFVNSSYGFWISMGTIFGTTMFLNVWLVIWPNQKIVIENATRTSKGESALPTAADAGARANVASRTNTMLSIPMLFFMGAASHLPVNIMDTSKTMIFWIIFFVLWAAIEFNAIKGKTYKLMTTVRQVTHSGVGLTVVLVGLALLLLAN